MQKLVTRLPLDHILLETDAPALGLEPNARNLPEHIMYSLEMLSALKSLPLPVMAEQTLISSRSLFSKADI